MLFGFIALCVQTSFASESRQNKEQKVSCDITAQEYTIETVSTNAIVFVITERFVLKHPKGQAKPKLPTNEAILSLGDQQIRQSNLIPKLRYMNRKT